MTSRRRAASSAADSKRCAVYTRKSTTMGLEQEFNSLDAQRDACVAYVERQAGWSLVDDRYDDGGFTGANTDRPAFTRLLADVDAGKVDVIVVHRVDRLSRSLLDFVKVMERLRAAGASFVSVTQNFSTADAMGRLTLNMLMSFAEFERSMIAERTRDKIAATRRKGQWTGGPVPFGYDAKDKKLVANVLEAQIVRQAFDLFVRHRQMAIVARLLTERGLMPRRSKRPSRNENHWSKDAIARVLRNPLYAGFIAYGDERYEGTHPAIVDRAIFAEAERILAGNARDLCFTGTNPDYVLRGLVRCGGCGFAMCPGSTTKKGKVYRYYRCSTRDKQGRDACGARPLPAGELEDFVVARITDAIAEHSLVAQVECSLRARIERQRESLTAVRRELRAAVAKGATNVERLSGEGARLDGRERERVEVAMLAETERLADAEQRLAQTERELVDVATAATEVEWMLDALKDFASVWELMTRENRGRLLRAVVAAVRVDEQGACIEVELVNFAAAAAAPQEAA